MSVPTETFRGSGMPATARVAGPEPTGARASRIAARLHRCNERIGRAVSWLTVVMVVVTFVIVVLRYLFDTGWVAMQESVTYMHALVFMLGAAYTLGHDGHVRVDIFYRAMTPRTRAWVDLIGTLVLLMPVCLFIAWVSGEYVSASWSVRESSPEAGGIPAVFVLKSVIPLTAGLLLMQGTVQCLTSIVTLTDPAAPAVANTREGL